MAKKKTREKKLPIMVTRLIPHCKSCENGFNYFCLELPDDYVIDDACEACEMSLTKGNMLNFFKNDDAGNSLKMENHFFPENEHMQHFRRFALYEDDAGLKFYLLSHGHYDEYRYYFGDLPSFGKAPDLPSFGF